MKILVIGSGPIVIGQAAEFDYAGTQACKSLKEEGHEVVLINSNPATIMTDPGVADALYIEPLNVHFCERVIARERPDALLPTLGGQTGLNLATQLSDQGILEKYDVKLLGTPLTAIRKAEDREQFRALMREIREPVPESWIVETPEQLEELLDVAPYPCIVRPAYTLGGTGGGIAHSRDELWEIGNIGLRLSMRSQIMVERSLLGWKEIEYEVMRDSAGNCITVCNMENFDPMGVHTGDSIVVAPSQTLSDIEYHMMRTASLKIIGALGIEGGCNVQMALNPDSFDYYIIEVNPRVSRSSALASKATGYPIARVAAKIAVGLTLDQIQNQVTKTTKACFEPALDYCVVKIPRWPFDKFASGDRTLFTQMKATGEVMAIDRTFEAALMKAIRGLEVKQKDLRSTGFQPVCQPGFQPGSERQFVNPDTEIEKKQGDRLPHWRQEGAIYACTFRLADSVPGEVQEEWRLERERIQLLESQDALTQRDILRARMALTDRAQDYLDQGRGRCVLRATPAAELVAGALRHFEGERYKLHAWCVMPNHVHVVVEPLADNELSDILHSWKSFTANKINTLLDLKGSLWQPESYDHLIRDAVDYRRQCEYAYQNPAKAGLGEWPWRFNGLEARDTHRLEAGATDSSLREAIRVPTDERLWAIAEGLRRGWSVDEVHKLCRVDRWFLRKIEGMIQVERRLAAALDREQENPYDLVAAAVAAGFGRRDILRITGIPDEMAHDIRRQRKANLLALSDQGKEALSAMRVHVGTDRDAEQSQERLQTLVEDETLQPMSSEHFFLKYPVSDRRNMMAIGILGALSTTLEPAFKMVDTCAGEFESKTPYYYATNEAFSDTPA